MHSLMDYTTCNWFFFSSHYALHHVILINSSVISFRLQPLLPPPPPNLISPLPVALHPSRSWRALINDVMGSRGVHDSKLGAI